MLNERELIGRLESADADELAELVVRSTAEEESVLRLYLGARSFQRLRSLALRRALQRSASRTAPKGNVVIVPGIFGCELSAASGGSNHERIWLSARSIAAGRFAHLRLDPSGRSDADPRYAIEATGIRKRDYGELILTLAEQWNVHVFWYDWRKDLRIAAAQLQARVNTWFAEQEDVHFVAHAEGGLVVRSYIAHYPESWNAHRRGKLIMLGTPNYGIYSAVQALTGQLEMIQWLDLLDTLHEETDIRSVIHSFPSLYQLLPAPLPELNGGLADLYQVATYGARPDISQAHLDSAKAYHAMLSKAVDTTRMIYIGGDHQPTLVGVNIDALSKNPRGDLRQLYTIGMKGDGRVPHKLGILRDQQGQSIPAYLLPQTSFGELHKQRAVLDALDDLLQLEIGKDEWRTAVDRYGLAAADLNDLLSEPSEPEEAAPKQIWKELEKAREARRQAFVNLMQRTSARSLPNDQPSRYTIEDSALEENLIRHFSMVRPEDDRHLSNPLVRFDPPEIRITVAYGNIAQIDDLAVDDPPLDAVAVGYYSGGKPESAMMAIDQEISRAVTGEESPEDERILYQFTQRGTIQGQLAQTFLLNDPRERGKALDRVIAIAGMGVPGRFGAPELTVLARELCWTVGRIGKKHLATTLIGAGIGNLSLTEALAAWLRGVKFALTGIDTKQGRSALAAITFVAHDPSKALEIHEALEQERKRYVSTNRMRITIAPLDEKTLKEVILPQWEAKQRRKAATTEPAGNDIAPTRVTVSLDGATYRFGAITNNASIPERAIPLDPDIVRRANDELAAETDPDRQLLLGQFMERLLIPADLCNLLAGSAPLVMMLDVATARLHWELMGQTTITPADNPADDQPHTNFWATSRGFTRQLRTTFAPPPEPPPPSSRLLRVLVVADPAADARLPGAEEEGILVADLFESFNLVYKDSHNRVEVVRLFGPSEATQTAVLCQLMMRTYDVLHFAGHCIYDPNDPPNSGWIFTGDQRLTSYELDRIDRVPKFIFSNACESGITPNRSERRTVELAPSFAEVFFRRGVSNLVCTAWPVDDRAAREFAITLYAQLLGMQDEAQAQQATASSGTHDGGKAEQTHRLGRTTYVARADGAQPMYRAMQAARCAIADAKYYDIRTWGAYQHYGNPYYRLFERTSLTPQPVMEESKTPRQGAGEPEKKSATQSPSSKAPGSVRPKSTKPAAQVDPHIFFNGINGRTGKYATPPASLKVVATLVGDEKLAIRKRALPPALISHMDDITRVGWGILHHQEEDSAVLDAIHLLSQHRQHQMGDENRIHKLVYHGEKNVSLWLENNKVALGSVNPTKVPFYLLVVGTPERIPFQFTSLLDLQYAVGRLPFATAEEYAAYARSVIAYEKNGPRNRKKAVFFATRHAGDPPTENSADKLVKLLSDGTGAGAPGIAAHHGFRTQSYWGPTATKQALNSLLGSASSAATPPAVLFAATHGAEWALDDDLQRAKQGALICQEWQFRAPLQDQDYFSAADVTDDARLHGLIAFLFACHSAGTPVQSRYHDREKVIFGNTIPQQLASAAFFAALPQRLLSHPQGGALACIGHIDKTWSASFMTAEPRLEPFYSSIACILSGKPVGMALMDFNDKFAVMSAELSGQIEEGAAVFDPQRLHAWLMRNDAEGYVLLGDPAVRLRVEALTPEV